jgi:hypothetical protein
MVARQPRYSFFLAALLGGGVAALGPALGWPTAFILAVDQGGVELGRPVLPTLLLAACRLALHRY